MHALTILYDEECALCLRCAAWLAGQPSYLPLELLPAGGLDARARFGVVPWLGSQLVVVADDGRVWAGASAFLMCFWALRDYRELSMSLSSPALAPLAERFFRVFSANRRHVAALFDHRPCAETVCQRPLSSPYR